MDQNSLKIFLRFISKYRILFSVTILLIFSKNILEYKNLSKKHQKGFSKKAQKRKIDLVFWSFSLLSYGGAIITLWCIRKSYHSYPYFGSISLSQMAREAPRISQPDSLFSKEENSKIKSLSFKKAKVRVFGIQYTISYYCTI
jgi:hypothetical protein